MTDPKELQYEAEVIEDERTGEEIPTGIQKVQNNTLATSLDLSKVGTTVLDEKAETVLNEALKPEEVSIRPDGLVYLPWTWYADRLNRAFGRLGWGLVPQAGPMKQDMGNNVLVVWGHWLVVRGVPVGFEMGECAYNPTNHTMSFGDAAAGAKSNALARNCKMLGMSLELFNQEWIEAWKAKYAERVKNPKGGRPEFIWRKKKANGQTEPPKQTITIGGAFNVENLPVPEGVEPVVVDGKPEPVYEDLKPYAEIKKVPVIAEISEKSGKTKGEVAIFIGKLDKTGSYSIEQIVKELKGEQNAAQ
jgi:hypothetical protein